ncbi:FAD-linked oxidase [Hoeflea sp. BAL378]|uniref:FAD-binding oxidoreductase n=1 Tax=Hoeflea sp. BAL378 TaxID=1547437 RepID=UPI000512CDF3|nr:FAD-binding oxidoreductase [Hoeflea sp. BAL378]KGF70737.1 FAD-linked oxidase [Hoeflea sp. BAL378]
MLHDEDLVAGLRAVAGAGGVVTGDQLSTRSCDPFHHVAPRGPALVRPASTRELAEVVGLCAARKQKIVTHGGCTGVAGGAYADDDEIVVSLERMNRIEHIDATGGFAIVQAGCTLQALDDALEPTGTFYPVDLGSRGTATVGGTLATNAGGNRVIRWGMTRANVMGIEAVLANGTVVTSLNSFLKNNSGYDLKQHFIGSEGTLGIITRAVLRLAARPTSQSVAFLSVGSFGQLLLILEQARRLMTLSAFEVLWQDHYALVAGDGGDRRPVAPDQPFYVLVETMGFDEVRDMEALERFLEQVVADDLCVEGVLARSQREVDALWRVREASDIIVRDMAPFISFDVSVDIAGAAAFAERARHDLRARFPDVRTVTFGHLADNNIHLGVHVGERTLEREGEIEKLVYDALSACGGMLTAEHGVGRAKKPFLSQFRTPEEIAAMQMIKHAFDPDRLLNRNVLI